MPSPPSAISAPRWRRSLIRKSAISRLLSFLMVLVLMSVIVMGFWGGGLVVCLTTVYGNGFRLSSTFWKIFPVSGLVPRPTNQWLYGDQTPLGAVSGGRPASA